MSENTSALEKELEQLEKEIEILDKEYEEICRTNKDGKKEPQLL